MAQPEHHFWFDRCIHSRGRNRELWKHPMHRAPLDWLAHTALHKEVSIVPVLDRHTHQRLVAIYEPVEGDYIATMHKLIDCIGTAATGAREQDRRLASITQWALEAQIPFIQDGLVL